MKETFLVISDHENEVYAETDKAIAEFVREVDRIHALEDCFGIKEYVDRIYCEWKKAINCIIDDVNIFERINQLLIAKKQGYKNIKAFKKQMMADLSAGQEAIYTVLKMVDDAKWLYEKFGDGKYTDILGLCKIASLTEIAEKGYSLTPGAYVGVAPVEDDGVDFAQRMGEIHRELMDLQRESNELMETISKNWKEIGL